MDFNKLKQSLKGFDWRSLQKLASPHAADDLNAFLEKLPQNTGQTMLIIAGVVWGFAGGVGLYTTVQLQKLTEIRIEFEEAEATKPEVPTIKDVAVRAQDVEKFANNIKDIYRGLQIEARGPSIVISAQSTGVFGQFREAVGHVQNGGKNWRVNIDKFCVGRECDKYPLYAALKINTVSVK